jgi:hypothetical protein
MPRGIRPQLTSPLRIYCNQCPNIASLEPVFEANHGRFFCPVLPISLPAPSTLYPTKCTRDVDSATRNILALLKVSSAVCFSSRGFGASFSGRVFPSRVFQAGIFRSVFLGLSLQAELLEEGFSSRFLRAVAKTVAFGPELLAPNALADVPSPELDEAAQPDTRMTWIGEETCTKYASWRGELTPWHCVPISHAYSLRPWRPRAFSSRCTDLSQFSTCFVPIFISLNSSYCRLYI